MNDDARGQRWIRAAWQHLRPPERPAGANVERVDSPRVRHDVEGPFIHGTQRDGGRVGRELPEFTSGSRVQRARKVRGREHAAVPDQNVLGPGTCARRLPQFGPTPEIEGCNPTPQHIEPGLVGGDRVEIRVDSARNGERSLPRHPDAVPGHRLRQVRRAAGAGDGCDQRESRGAHPSTTAHQRLHSTAYTPLCPTKYTRPACDSSRDTTCAPASTKPSRSTKSAAFSFPVERSNM